MAILGTYVYELKSRGKKSKKIKAKIKGFKLEKIVRTRFKKCNFAIWFSREMENVGIPQIALRHTWSERWSC